MNPDTLDCGDNSCLFAEPRGGMRTNGGCRCLVDLSPPQRRNVTRYLQRLRAKIAMLRGECQHLAHGGEYAAEALRARVAELEKRLDGAKAHVANMEAERDAALTFARDHSPAGLRARVAELEAKLAQLEAMRADYESARDCICWGVDCVHEARALNIALQADARADEAQTEAWSLRDRLARALRLLRRVRDGTYGSDLRVYKQAARELLAGKEMKP